MRESTSFSVRLFLAGLSVLCGLLLFGEEAYASWDCVTRPDIPLSTDSSGTVTYMDPNPSGGSRGTQYAMDAPYGILTHVFVGCLEDAVVYLGVTSFQDFRDNIRSGIAATLALFIALFSMKAMFNAFEKEPAAELSIMVLKLTGVAFFLFYGGVEYFIPQFYAFMAELTNMITETMPGSAECTDERIWLRIDCNIVRLMGADIIATTGADNPSTSNPWALFSLGAQRFFTADGAVMSGIIAVISPFIMAAFATACVTYLLCLIAMTVLMIIAPIPILLYLFTYTQTTFLEWLKLLLNYMIQPMILFGYIIFSLHVIGYIVEGPPGASSDTVLGLRPILQDVVDTLNEPDYKSHKPNVTGQTPVEEGAPLVADPAQGKNDEVEGWSFVITDYEYRMLNNNPCTDAPDQSSYVDCRSQHIIINLMILTVTLMLVLSFMKSVMQKAGGVFGSHTVAGLSGPGQKNIFDNTTDLSKSLMQSVFGSGKK